LDATADFLVAAGAQTLVWGYGGAAVG
jgi:hypothetical protein